MAERHQILCITKSDRTNPHERITHIGIKNSEGKIWKITEASAIDRMETDNWTFYVERLGLHVEVIIATRDGQKYLKTRNDGARPDNLLALDEC
jgi:hypothetical protein